MLSSITPFSFFFLLREQLIRREDAIPNLSNRGRAEHTLKLTLITYIKPALKLVYSHQPANLHVCLQLFIFFLFN